VDPGVTLYWGANMRVTISNLEVVRKAAEAMKSLLHRPGIVDVALLMFNELPVSMHRGG
jgi:hypothetical protein